MAGRQAALANTLLQLAGARGGSWQAALANTFLQPAPGGDPRKHMLRQARVFALPELFVELGARFTARAIYEYYLSARIIVHKQVRSRGSLERQGAAHERNGTPSYYGFGRR